MPKAENFVYAVVGAGDFAIEKVKNASKLDRKKSEKLYKDFVKRGQKLSTSIKNSRPTKRAVEQTKVARSQVKSAATSVRKAVGTNAKATKSAAGKAAKAS
ncbi:MAG TPA: hypothetical protein VEV82_11045 [Actinomycetota bacterium]|nr:hypothetical protein [Actinomycetota bacterium]